MAAKTEKKTKADTTPKKSNGHGGARPGAGRKERDEIELKGLIDKAWTTVQREEALRVCAAYASSGSIKHMTLLMAYAYGKPVETREVTGADGEPLKIVVEYVNDLSTTA